MLVIFAGGLVLLLAIAAIVVDVGYVLMLRRMEQNAADPGAVAAARYIPAGVAGRPSMWTAACFYASQNGFIPERTDNGSSCIAGQPADGSTLTVNYPPSPGAGEFAGNSAYVEVVVHKPHQSFFAGVVGLPTIGVTSSAVAAWDDGTGGTSSLVALDPSACAAARLHGGGSGGGVNIFAAPGVPPDSGGYVQVNSDCGAGSGGDDDCTNVSDGGLVVAGGTFIESNTIYIQGGCDVNGASGDIHAPVEELATYVGDPLALIRPPSPADLPTRDCPTGPDGTPTTPRRCGLSGSQTLEPGTYYGGWRVTGSGTTITLNPGIYILAGGGLTQTGGVTVAAASGRVLIYSTDSPVCGNAGAPAEACQDIIDFRGSTSLNLRGLSRTDPCPPYGSAGCPYGGMLIWQDGNGAGLKDIDLEGNGSLFLEGTIYTSGGDVLITGNGLSTGCTPDINGETNCAAVQVIANTFEVGGGGVLAMPYDPNLFYQLAFKGLVR
ncbi:MAG TPA: pilus assembly protein TadG-related protein [Candidatus Limnocylindrales bacterium]|nr:pilus assembly protein TadG-related protein [Candidatus Limnocylindrales bacterium]